MKIYLAGPLFTSAERLWNARLAGLLEELGHEVYLPQAKEPGDLNARAIFEADRKGIDGADVVVAIMDGPDPDSGTCWECGYAYEKKPIVLVRTDFRRGGRAGLAPYNAMLTESADVHMELPFASVEDTARGVHKALASLNTPRS
jgi:nucleoside 2-deoxyribosyltransferase